MTSTPSPWHPSTLGRLGQARHTLVAAAVATALGVFCASGASAQSASAADLQNLQDQIQRLQHEVDRMKQQQAQQATQAQAAPASAPAAEAAAAQKSVPSAPTWTAGPLTLQFSGFTAFESVYRNKNESADVGSNYNSAIPFNYQTNAHISEFRASARQSRLALLAQGPVTGSLSAEAWYETDFLSAGTSSNSSESNSYTLRMRNFYGVLKDKEAEWYLLAGQNWSLATLYPSAQLSPRSERSPQTIDAQYVVGFNWTRNAQLRFVKTWGKTLGFGLSIESPQAAFTGTPSNTLVTNTGGSLLNSGANYSIDFAPDMIAKFSVDPGYGHYEVYGMARGFRDRFPNTTAGTNNTTWGGGVGAGMVLPLIDKQLEFQASGLFGSGIGRYGSGQLPDATVRPDGTVAAIHEWHGLLGLLYKPTSMWTFYLYGGEEQASRAAYSTSINTGYGNPLYDNSGCDSLTGKAATCVANTKTLQQIAAGSWWKVYQGDIGNFQVGLQYSYTNRKTFAGVGGDPSTNISMGFVSFRYYPFQK